jgi:hypothetical protein
MPNFYILLLSPKSNEFNLKLVCDKKAEYIVFPIVSPEKKKLDGKVM